MTTLTEHANNTVNSTQLTIDCATEQATTKPAANDVTNIRPRTHLARPLITPRALRHQIPLSDALQRQVTSQRGIISNLLNNQSNTDKLMVITGPCSLHDEKATLDYAHRLQQLNTELSDRLLIVMRAYVEKPRTTTGWKGLAYDPARDNSGDIELGLRRSRALLLKLVEMGLPLAIEALNPMTMLYLDDLISWTAIGARTSESQIHREMISHLTMPVGIKNGTDGTVENAINAMISASRSHHCLGTDLDGQIAMLDTQGNPDTHIVLRGGKHLTNYDQVSIRDTVNKMAIAAEQNTLHAKVIVDCSHGNSQKQHHKQISVAHDVVKQHQGLDGYVKNPAISGIMLESFIEEGNQGMEGPNNDGNLTYGQSITDACISWDQTETLLKDIYAMMS